MVSNNTTVDKTEERKFAENSRQSRLNEFKHVLPQIVSASLASCFCFLMGLANSFPAIVIAHLSKSNSTTGENDLRISENGLSWFVSCGAMVSPISALIAGIIVDRYGRIRSLRLATIPCIAGWILLYFANAFVSLVLGRLLLNFASAWFIISVSTYIAEISSPSIRATLLNLKVLGISFGMFSSHLLASYVNWRSLTLINVMFALACWIMSMFLHESALWLVTKSRLAAATKSLSSFNRFKKTEKENFDDMVERELLTLEAIYTNRNNNSKYSGIQQIKFFLQPCGYKPLLIVTGLHFFQEFSGVTVIFLHLITFFDSFGTEINPSNAAVYVTGAKFLTGICNLWVMKRFYRRTLLFVSCTGMAISMIVIALNVELINQGLGGYDWIVLCGLMLYTITCTMGMLLLPTAISTELFPTHIRGTGQAVCSVISSLLQILAIQSYYFYKSTFRDSTQLLLLFGLTSLLGCIFIYAFVPETHRKILAETENYYLTSEKKIITIEDVAVIYQPTKRSNLRLRSA